ncbi:MAG TPA: hypothetical protein ENI33_03350 [Thermoplasmatales archaeon]|nr:hypothetical protein [Thermoplasmatales archaeon]
MLKYRKTYCIYMKMAAVPLCLMFIFSTISFSEQHYIFYDGMIRTYSIHVPLSYDGSETPLFIVLHGGGGNSWHMEEKTGFSKKADEMGFIVLYPDGTWKFSEYNILNALLSLFMWKNRFLTWNSGYCCGYAYEKNIDDVGYIDMLIEKVKRDYNVNSSRIYVVGHSNGGMLAYRIASELSNKISAAGIVAGSIGGYANANSTLWMISQPSHPVSIIHIHGMHDSHVPYNGGHGENATGTRIDLAVNDSISFWVEADECNPLPETNFIYNETIKVDRYIGGKNNSEVVLYSLIYGEHWWPGKNYRYFNFDATDAVLLT